MYQSPITLGCCPEVIPIAATGPNCENHRQKPSFPEDLMATVEDRLPFIFQYTYLGQNMLSTSPSDSNPAVELDDTLIPVPNPRAYPHKDISDTDMDDNEGPKLAWSPKDNMLFKIADAPWYPHALRFLSQVPQSDGDWSRHISCNDDIQSLCHSLKLPSGFQDHIDWSRLFDECARHLARACHNPPLASFFSLIFVATCQVALVGGCPRKTVLRGLELCARHCGVAEDELTELVLDNVREGVITGIRLLKEYTRVVGCRANEIPLHTQDCLQLFRRCDSACFSFIQSHISSTYRPTTPLQSDCLEIPALVYDLLGGGVRYQVIVQILCPEKADGVYGYNSVDMTDVMEFDERDDRDD